MAFNETLKIISNDEKTVIQSPSFTKDIEADVKLIDLKKMDI